MKTPKSMLAHYGDLASQSAQSLFPGLLNNIKNNFSYSLSFNLL